MENQIKTETLEAMKEIQIQRITPFFWFDNKAEEAANYYASVFRNARVKTKTYYNEDIARSQGLPKGLVMTVAFDLEGLEFAALNGGPIFHINPSVSFMVHCRTQEKLDDLWNNLRQGGKILMELDEYPFAERYGWIEDKYGVSWQLILKDEDQIMAPCLLFSGKQRGKAEEAIEFYCSVFKTSAVENIVHYTEDEEGPTGAVKFAAFTLNNQNFKIMDSGIEVPHEMSPAISFVINCHSQKEIDHYWDKLTEDGDPEAQQCGWLKDKYGVSWQVIPDILPQWIADSESESAKRVFQALMPMKKINMTVLKQAYEMQETNEENPERLTPREEL